MARWLIIILLLTVLSDSFAIKYYTQVSFGKTRIEKSFESISNIGHDFKAHDLNSMNINQVLFGVNLTKYFSIDAFYSDFGDFTDPETFLIGAAGSNTHITPISSATSTTIALNSHYDIKKNLQLFIKVGYGKVTISNKFKSVNGFGETTFSDPRKQKGNDMYYSFGMGIRLTSHSSMVFSIEEQSVDNLFTSDFRVRKFRVMNIGYKFTF